MNFLRRAASAYVESSRTFNSYVGSRAISTSFSSRKASKPDLRSLEAGEEYGDEEDVYTSSFDEIAPSSVSHDIAPIDTSKLSPAYFNQTPRERRLEEIKKISSMKQLNKMLGAIKPAHWTLKDHELKETFIRGSGNGGQAINKLSTCVSIIHLPTGIRVKAQPTRSRNDNRIAARKILAEKLAQLDPNSTRESRDDILRARVALKRRRAMKRANKGLTNKADVGLIGAPPSEEDLDEDEDGFDDEDEEGEDEAEGLVEVKENQPVLSMLEEKELKKADKEVRDGLKKARKLERKEKKEVKEEKKRLKEEKAQGKAAKKRS